MGKHNPFGGVVAVAAALRSHTEEAEAKRQRRLARRRKKWDRENGGAAPWNHLKVPRGTLEYNRARYHHQRAHPGVWLRDCRCECDHRGAAATEDSFLGTLYGEPMWRQNQVDARTTPRPSAEDIAAFERVGLWLRQRAGL